MARRRSGKPETTPMIVKQETLRGVVELRKSVADALAKLGELNRELGERTSRVIAELTAGGKIEPGELVAVLKRTKGPRRPGWRHHFVLRLGEKAAEEVLAATPAPTITTLVIGPASEPGGGPEGEAG